jgi:hypothetical protein
MPDVVPYGIRETAVSPRPSSHPLSGPASYAAGSLMLVGQTLRRQSLTSPSGSCTLVYQDDGNLVLWPPAVLRQQEQL